MFSMTSFIRKAFCAVVVCSLAVAAVPGRAQQALTMEGYPAAGAAPIVKLISPGTAPLTRLRYKVAAGQKSTMVMTMNMGMNVSMGGQPMPAMDMPVMKMTTDIATTAVSPTGDISYNIVVTGMTAESAPGADPTVAQIFSGAADAIKNLKGTAVISDRGVKRSSKLDLEAVSDATVKQALQSFSSSIENIASPLPEEAIGPGAKWEVRQSTNVSGMTAFQKSEYELVSVVGNVATIRVKTDQTAPPQPMNNPALPAGLTMMVEKMLGTGTGTITLDLTTLIPKAEMSMTTDASIVMDMGGTTQPMGMTMKLKTTVAPAK
jgi:hypothetical protein